MGTLALKVDGAAGVPLTASSRDAAAAAGRRRRARRGAASGVWAFACGWRAGCACSRWSPKARRSRSSA